MKQEEYDFNFANNENKEQRDEQLKRLKQIQAELTGMLVQTNNVNDEYQNNDDLFTNGNSNDGIRQKANQKSLSTSVGRAMNSYDHQSGFSSALMLGIISFMFEAIFLALAIFIYR